MINCVIIDDEQFSIDVIVKYINLINRLSITEIYVNPKNALAELSNREDIDIIFMDVDMPDISGIELGKLLRAQTRKLIFTTSHSKYAFDAYEVNGDAFLHKPFTFVKFSETIDRLFPLREREIEKITNNSVTHFFVKNKDENLRIIKVNFDDVIAFESVHNYVKIHVVSNKIITAYLTLKDVWDLIEQRSEFQQFHRAFVISSKHIQYIEDNTIFLENNLNFRVGTSFREIFSNYLSSQLLKTGRKQKTIGD